MIMILFLLTFIFVFSVDNWDLVCGVVQGFFSLFFFF
jgi:hypothetical protein